MRQDTSHEVSLPSTVPSLATDETALFATTETYGILDTGATKSVIDSALIPDLLKGLHPDVRRCVFRCKCAVTVRFGNQGTLDSQSALVIPIPWFENRNCTWSNSLVVVQYANANSEGPG